MAWGLAAMLVAAAASLPPAVAAPSSPAAPSLDDLAGTLNELTASLSAIREDMAAMRADQAPPGPEALCGPPSAAAAEARHAGMAADGDWRHAAAAMTGELINTRERLAAAEAAAAALQHDRERLVGRITELDRMLQKARTSELVDGLVEERRAAIAPLDSARADQPVPAAGAAATAKLLRVARPALADEAHPALQPTGGRRLARASSHLDLQAELALAQLRIVELNTALEAARMQQEAMAAEVTTLRSLTGAGIERFLGQQD